MAKTIFLTGVPGVGKTYLLNRPYLKERIDNDGFLIVSMGSEIFEVAKKEKIAFDRDDLRRLDRETQMQLQNLACEKIQSDYVDQDINIIVDTHASILTPQGYLGTFSVWTAQAVDIDFIIILEANPEDIRKRRENDKTRKRLPSIHEIVQHQDFNRAMIASYVTYSTTIAKIIDNTEGKTETAENDFITVIGA